MFDLKDQAEARRVGEALKAMKRTEGYQELLRLLDLKKRDAAMEFLRNRNLPETQRKKPEYYEALIDLCDDLPKAIELLTSQVTDEAERASAPAKDPEPAIVRMGMGSGSTALG